MSKDYGLICDIGGKNKGNQDSAFFIQFDLKLAPASTKEKFFSHNGILALVCDGVSASHHGDEGSSFVVKTLPTKILHYFLTENVDFAQIQNIIVNAIKETNNELINKFSSEIQKGNIPKTTLVGFLIIGPWIWVFNLGDSRAYLIKDNEIRQISIDHIGTGASHEITEAMGQKTIHPYIKTYNWAYNLKSNTKQKIYQKQFYGILCSDGLTDKVSDSEINDFLQKRTKNESLQDIVMKLYNLSIERKIEDNISIIIIDMKEFFEKISEIEKIRLDYS
ncbi:PP2C family serine/threonine-protein phosphatase [Candidatus Harpocratesius sp.]